MFVKQKHTYPTKKLIFFGVKVSLKLKWEPKDNYFFPYLIIILWAVETRQSIGRVYGRDPEILNMLRLDNKNDFNLINLEHILLFQSMCTLEEIFQLKGMRIRVGYLYKACDTSCFLQF